MRRPISRRLRLVPLQGLALMVAAAALLLTVMAAPQCAALSAAAAAASGQDSPPAPSSWSPRPVPAGTLIIGYSSDPSGPRVPQALAHGVNVVCWSFVHLDVEGRTPIVRTDLDLEAIRRVRADPAHPDVLHVAAIGGWNGPHPPPGIGGAEWAAAFDAFNERNGHVFDGIDWDLEGHDDRSAPTSAFSLETLDVMADMSTALRGGREYTVSMAPAESYLDSLAGTDGDGDGGSGFDLRLDRFPVHWEDDPDRGTVEGAGFSHAGQQAYAYVLHRAGAEAFDWVAVQLYESYSRYLRETTVVARRALDLEGGAGDGDGDGRGNGHHRRRRRRRPALDVPRAQMDALRRRAVAMYDGFPVDLPGYGTVTVQVPPGRLVFGFANGWADGTKSVRIERRALNRLFVQLKTRGVMFWTIDEEGTRGQYLAREIREAQVRAEETDWHDLNDDVLPPEDEDEDEDEMEDEL